MDMWEYTQKVKELFLHPRNVGEVPDANAVGEVGSMICGDALRLTLKIDSYSGRIQEAQFQTFGCASAIASSSALTEMIKGKTIDEALQISNQDIARFLGGLPQEKMHCSVMGREALEAAIDNYRGITHTEDEEGEVVCKCFGVTDQKIRHVAAENNLHTVEDITNFTKAGGGCGECIPTIEALLRESVPSSLQQKTAASAQKLTNIKKISMIQEIIEEEVRPRLQSDGGDVELIDVDGNRVLVSLRGMCTGCLMAEVTISGIENKLKELVSPDIVVETE